MRTFRAEKLAFDIDGVVADTMALFVEIARDRFGISGLRKEDITSYILDDCLPVEPEILEAVVNIILEMSHDTPLRPIPGAVEGLRWVAEASGGLFFVTARPHREAISEWLGQTLGLPADKLTVHATGSFEAKAGVLKDAGRDWFVEDRLETCFLLKEEGLNPVVFCQPWNRKPHPFVEVATWPELLERIRKS